MPKNFFEKYMQDALMTCVFESNLKRKNMASHPYSTEKSLLLSSRNHVSNATLPWQNMRYTSW